MRAKASDLDSCVMKKQAAMDTRKQSITLIALGGILVGLAALTYSSDKTFLLGSAELAILACVLVAFGVLPATRNRPASQWPKSYRIFAKCVCIAAILGLILQSQL